MGLSKTTKLYIQLSLSVILFFTELIVGYWVGSIALVADAFHMLNDVVSLVIAVYAVKLAQDTRYNPKYSYGLQRAEVLGALINAVLLLGLCLTIVAEAIPRFFEPVEINNPQLILIVGSIGFLFNILGVFLFGHDHGHNHGHSHSHKHDVETGHGYIEDNLRSPALFQQTIIDTARQVSESQVYEESESSRLLSPSHAHGKSKANYDSLVSHSPIHSRELSHDHNHSHSHDHSHSHGHDHGHSHGHGHDGALNMHGVYLHVLGDALASLAVIFTALVIWLSESPYRFYFDPIVSIVITFLIIRFTLPLVKSASIILLQGVPSSVPLDEVRSEVLNIEGVVGIHELHVWQLSDTKAVGSVHVVIDSPHHDRFVHIATRIKKILHKYNVHSVTIQPELTSDEETISPDSPEQPACRLSCQADCITSQCCPPLQDMK